jgi:predicted RNA-binding Zn-ribbon protein involved in translation (DUF1610 family)
MQSRQLVGLKCALCHKTVASVVDGAFCPSCGNPVHVKCRRPARDAAPAGQCADCGGEEQNPIAVQVRILRDQPPGTGDTRLACPNCHSDRGFRPYGELSDPGLALFRLILFGVLLYWLIESVNTGQLQCLDCDYIFRPRNRAREYGCMAVLAVLLVALLVWAVLPRG